MVNGNFVVAQLAVEEEYGTVPAMTHQIRIASEGFKWTPEKRDEGLLTGGKTSGRVFTTSIKADGALSTNARPDEIGYFLGAALGTEAAVATVGVLGKKHTFTSIGNSGSLSSLSFVIDRIVEAYEYSGMKVMSLSFSAQPGDYLKVDVVLTGKDEGEGTVATGLVLSALKPFRFSHAAVKFENDTLADVTSIKFDYNNNLEAGLQTTSTGVYFKEPEVGMREIKIDLEILYSAESDGIRNDFFKTDDECSVDIIFTSEEEIEEDLPYSLKFIVPNCQILECSPPNVSGAETMKQSMSLKAIEVGTDELITAELVNKQSSKYI